MRSPNSIHFKNEVIRMMNHQWGSTRTSICFNQNWFFFLKKITNKKAIGELPCHMFSRNHSKWWRRWWSEDQLSLQWAQSVVCLQRAGKRSSSNAWDLVGEEQPEGIFLLWIIKKNLYHKIKIQTLVANPSIYQSFVLKEEK